MAHAGLQTTLAQNAYGFLNESIRNATRAEDVDSSIWVFAIVNAVQAIELLLKERLRREHPVLVFGNVDKPGRFTVSLDSAISRLSHCGVILDPDDAVRLQNAKDIRNDVVHYQVTATPAQMADAYVDLFEFAHGFHARELGEELHPHLDEELWGVEARLMERFRAEFVLYQGEELLKTFPSEIVSAQQIRFYKTAEGFSERVAFGSEHWYDESDDESENCGDCGVLVDQLHVPGCASEQCPACGTHAALCPCEPEERSEPYPTLFDGTGISFARPRRFMLRGQRRITS